MICDRPRLGKEPRPGKGSRGAGATLGKRDRAGVRPHGADVARSAGRSRDRRRPRQPVLPEADAAGGGRCGRARGGPGSQQGVVLRRIMCPRPHRQLQRRERWHCNAGVSSGLSLERQLLRLSLRQQPGQHPGSRCSSKKSVPTAFARIFGIKTVNVVAKSAASASPGSPRPTISSRSTAPAKITHFSSKSAVSSR